MTTHSLPLQRVLEELRDFDTALLANTIGYIKEGGDDFYLSAAIQSVTPTLGPTVGIAFTCELDSSTPGNVADTRLYWEQLDDISKQTLPAVWVVKATGSRPDHECVLGDGMAKTLYSVGCQGVVSDGYVRDVAGLLTTPFAAYCRGKAIHHTPLRFSATNCPVDVGGVTIQPGDVLHANAEGVIRIPPECISRLPEAAVRMRAFEHEAHMMSRRTDIGVRQKQREIEQLVTKYGFNGCVTSVGRKC